MVIGRSESTLKMINNNTPLSKVNNELCSILGVSAILKTDFFPVALHLRIIHHVEQVKIMYPFLSKTDAEMFDNIIIECNEYSVFNLCNMINKLEEHYPISYPRYH
jgi:hypothetical protein